MVKPACLLHIFHRVPAGRQCPCLCPLSLSVSLYLSLSLSLHSLILVLLSSRLIPSRASPAFHMLIYCQQTHVAFVSALLACLATDSPTAPPSPPPPASQPLVCMYIPFLIKVDKCPPPQLLFSSLPLSTVIEQPLKIDYENRLLKFFTRNSVYDASEAQTLLRSWLKLSLHRLRHKYFNRNSCLSGFNYSQLLRLLRLREALGD